MKYSILAIFAVVSLNAANLDYIPSSCIKSPSKIGPVSIYHNEGKFMVVKSGKVYTVNNYDVDPFLRDIVKKELLMKFLEENYIEVGTATEQENSFYTLKGHVALRGGGPICAKIAYGAVKAIAWGGVIAAVGATLATTAPGKMALGVLGESSRKIPLARGRALPGGAAVVAATIDAAGGTKLATDITMGATNAAVKVGLRASIEAAACGAYAWVFTWPTP